ncbi:pilus assembly protein PilS [Neisseria meningitidis]|nr:pilus assembly protein PilS [Neisseria meningitidis]RQK11330.1 pilus assembly protein PilS [Neisseria meningitidis]RQK17816.1 pilus assembly protein PilS [Neisseria meningitidis]RQK21329.1 pilus assembly protein PilS [Neisseria meningitidis]RQK47202.1 pilus assembly protein PilS [Neisseria meningitidis]
MSGFQSFPIDSRRVRGLDSRLRGNDEFQDYGVVGRVSRLRCCRNATEPSFPRKWESRTRGLSNCFYPISFCADRSGFPPARE